MSFQLPAGFQSSLSFLLLLLVPLIAVSGQQVESIQSLVDFDTPAPDNAQTEQFLTESVPFLPFQYHQQFLRHGDSDFPFSYNPRDRHGPQNWGREFPVCDGRAQSPVDIRSRSCPSHPFSSRLKYVHSDKQPTKVTIENNEYSIGYSFEFNGTRPFLTGGPLRSKYIFESMHFHVPSEHAINGHLPDLEMHLIHRNVQYRTFAEAIEHRDGLVVLGLMADASATMPSLDTFKHINDVRHPRTKVVLKGRPVGFILRNLFGFLPKERLMMYRGSLTTPPCSESVLWLVPETVRKVSRKDIDGIRRTRGNLGPNNRPVQRMNNRACVSFNLYQQP